MAGLEPAIQSRRRHRLLPWMAGLNPAMEILGLIAIRQNSAL
jgi:hypothetical protein